MVCLFVRIYLTRKEVEFTWIGTGLDWDRIGTGLELALGLNWTGTGVELGWGLYGRFWFRWFSGSWVLGHVGMMG